MSGRPASINRVAVVGAGTTGAQIAQRHRFDRSGDEADRPSRMLEEPVERGHLGRGSGRAIDDYPDSPVAALWEPTS